MKLLFGRSKLLTASTVLAAALVVFYWATVQATLASPGGFDTGIRTWVQNHESKSVATLLWVVTQTGAPEFIACVGLLVAWREHRAHNRDGAVVIVVTVVGALLLNETLKHIFHRARPSPFFGMAMPASFSYPSGHALCSASFYGLLSSARLRFVFLILIAVIGFSRIYLGVHYPSDVAGGFAVGAAWVATVMLVCNGRLSA
jgi:undecaprenyl-diphosphatase